MRDLTLKELELEDEKQLKAMGLVPIDPLLTADLHVTAAPAELPTRTSDGSWIQDAEYEGGYGDSRDYDEEYL